jgi:1-acyl-sn-glycerol-3-phosphate acyltransferase
MQTLSAIIRLIAFLLITLMVMPVQALALLLNLELARTLPHYYFRAVAITLKMQVIVKGSRPMAGPALIAANHVSWLDIVALSVAAPMVFVAKREVAQWPLFGWLAKLGQTIFVNREKRQDTARVRTDMQQRLRDGRLVVLFAEGTSTDGNRVIPFRSSLLGAVEVLAGTSPVVPVTIGYVGLHGIPLPRAFRPRFAWFGSMSLPSHLWGVAKMGPFEVTILFHEALVGHSGRKALARAAEDQVRRGLAGLLSGRSREPVSSNADLR